MRGRYAVGGVLEPFYRASALRNPAFIGRFTDGSQWAGGIPIFVSAGGQVLVVEDGFPPVILPGGLR